MMGFLVSLTLDQTSALLLTKKRVEWGRGNVNLPVHVEEGKVLVLHLLDVGPSRERLLVPRQHHRPNARILGFKTTS